MRPESTAVFSFPMKAPEGARTREDLTAIQHLDLWMMYQRHWCEHKPSVTISVKEEEWMDVGAWVWKNFNEISGVSFLPYDGGTYRQAPYEECTKEQYEELLAKMPTTIDWDSLVEYDDNVEGVQTLACTGSSCEI
jgi:ribonucleoside-diphosphate reductase alpha chain